MLRTTAAARGHGQVLVRHGHVEGKSKAGIDICARTNTTARVRRGADEEHAEQDPQL